MHYDDPTSMVYVLCMLRTKLCATYSSVPVSWRSHGRVARDAPRGCLLEGRRGLGRTGGGNMDADLHAACVLHGVVTAEK